MDRLDVGSVGVDRIGLFDRLAEFNYTWRMVQKAGCHFKRIERRI